MSSHPSKSIYEKNRFKYYIVKQWWCNDHTGSEWNVV